MVEELPGIVGEALSLLETLEQEGKLQCCCRVEQEEMGKSECLQLQAGTPECLQVQVEVL